MNRWEAIVLSAAIFAVGCFGVSLAVSKSLEAKAAMENGYEQFYESGHVLWKKAAEAAGGEK